MAVKPAFQKTKPRHVFGQPRVTGENVAGYACVSTDRQTLLLSDRSPVPEYYDRSWILRHSQNNAFGRLRRQGKSEIGG